MAAIEAMGLSKRYGSVQAVADLSFGVDAGRVTGFIGPNGAGKSTTLRMLLGLVRPDSGSAPAVDGHVGAVLEDMSYHPGRSGRNHLRVVAVAGGHGTARVDELLERVGLCAAPPTSASRAIRRECASASASRRRSWATPDPDPRRAGQRPRPARDPLDPRSSARRSRAGTRGARVEPPALRARPERR